MALLAALLALALWSLARPLVASPALRAAVAFVAAQPALLFGYYLWGGVKEVARGGADRRASPPAPRACVASGCGRRSLLAPALLCAGADRRPERRRAASGWCPALGARRVLLAARTGLARGSRPRGARLAGARRRCSALPVLVSGGLLPPTSSPLTDGGARGNLIGRARAGAGRRDLAGGRLPPRPGRRARSPTR